MSRKFFYTAICISIFVFFFTVSSHNTFPSWLLFSVFVWSGLIFAYWLSQEQLPQLPQSDKTSTELQNLLQSSILFPLVGKERLIFKYAYAYLVILYSVDTLQIVATSYIMKPLRDIKYDIAFNTKQLLIVVGIGLIFWSFRVCQQLFSKTLVDLFYNHRILVRNGDLNECFLSFLKNTRDEFRKPLRYIVIGSIVVLYVLYYFYIILRPAIRDEVIYHFKNTPFVISFIIHLLFIALTNFIAVYCLGVIIWALYILGMRVKQLIRIFEFRIEPLHPDQCGGLKVLGNFCFSLASPIFIGSAFFIGYIFAAVLSPKNAYNVETISSILFIILTYGLSIVTSSFCVPFWNIHREMLHEREADIEKYAENLEVLRQAIQKALNNGMPEDADKLKKQMDLIQALHTNYPQWPFDFGSKFLSSFFTIIGSILLGFITALQQPLVSRILGK